MNAQALRLEIQKLKTLPPLPQNRQRILAAVNDPDVNIEWLGELLAECPSLTARLIGLANSAYFGRADKIHTLKEAIVHLGLNMVKSLTIAVLLSESLKPDQCPAFLTECYWLNALLNAHVSQQLAFASKNQAMPEPSVAYTAGLLMQIGMLALVCAQPDLMQEVLLEARQNATSIRQMLQDHFETDQYQIGKWLILRWQLPEIYANAVGAQSLALEQLKKESQLACLLLGARRLAPIILEEEGNGSKIRQLSPLLNLPSPAIETIAAKLRKKKQLLQVLARQFH